MTMEAKVPRLAIAMAVYNDASSLRRTLGALAESTVRDFQLTIVDDGSSDESVAVAESFADRLDVRVMRAPHRGIYPTKRDAHAAADPRAPFFMVLDSDILLPPHALERMLSLLSERTDAAVVSGEPRASTRRAWGRALAFIDDLFYTRSHLGNDEGRWISGGCSMYRREALAGATFRTDVMEDAGLAEQLRAQWKILAPRDLVVEHLGVPSSVRGLLRFGFRTGMRIASTMRHYPSAYQAPPYLRLVPLALVAVGAGGLVTLNPLLTAGSLVAMVGYNGLFLIASREVEGTVADRIGASAAFFIQNLGYGVGYLRERAFGKAEDTLAEPSRA